MAPSPSHKLGQIIGDMLEASLEVPLRQFAAENNLYLDIKEDRPARKGKKCTWRDKYGNAHDLDFVLERHGTKAKIGKPVGFIEVAWRSYTKHSRNKAQEIQGAIQPLRETYSEFSPFTGVLLAGNFTEGPLTQLRSLGFTVLYYPFDSVIEAFRSHGVDVSFDENTPTAELAQKVEACDALGEGIAQVGQTLFGMHKRDAGVFLGALKEKVNKSIESVVIIPLFGEKIVFESLGDAIVNVDIVDRINSSGNPQGFEVIIHYTNSDKVHGRFADSERVKSFLKSLVS